MSLSLSGKNEKTKLNFLISKVAQVIFHGNSEARHLRSKMKFKKSGIYQEIGLNGRCLSVIIRFLTNGLDIFRFVRETYKGNNVKNLTDFKFDGLAWSNDKDFSVMFDGLVDIGVGYFNNMGKQE